MTSVTYEQTTLFVRPSLFGDHSEVEFWSLAVYYLLREKHRVSDPRYSVSACRV